MTTPRVASAAKPPSLSETVSLLPPPAPAESKTLASSAPAGVSPGRDAVPGYEILAELGRGGMGVVYQARQATLGRIVALKMILSGVHASAADLARFRTEAEAIARLQHPNIVQIHEVGEHNGLPFFSLEFCAGGSLETKLAGTPLPASAAAGLIQTLARAMQAAHEKGVIHRDLKPANVLLAEDGTPKVTDFGLAKKLEEAGQTASGAIMGTPSYMAPEQAGGKAVGPLADVYALGAILYQCLTGRPPFKAASPLDTIIQVVSDDPVPPTQLQSKAPRDLETICLKCLQKEPSRRYASAAALAEDLRRFQAGEPITARPVGLAEWSVKWVRRNPAWAALAGVTSLALLTVTLGSLWFAASLGKAYGDASNALDRAKGAEKGEKEKLYGSYVDQAEARRYSRRMGQRFEALAGIRKAVDLLGQLDWPEDKRLQENEKLRNLAIACLALADVRVIREWDGWPAGSFALAVEDTLQLYAREDNQGNVSVRRIADDVEVGRWAGDGHTYSLTFAPEGRFLLLRRDNRIWGWRPGEKEAFIAIQEDAVVCGVRIRPDGKQAAVALRDGRVNLYPLPGGPRERSLKIPEWNAPVGDDLRVLEYSLDGRQLAVGGGGYGEPGGRNVFVYSLDVAGPPALLRHDDSVYSAAWDPDGKTLRTGCWNSNDIYTWDVPGRKVLGVDRRQRGGAPFLAVNRTGEMLVSTSDWAAGTRLWHSQTGQELLQITDRYVDFQPAADGRLFATQTENGLVRLLECVPGRECRTLVRDQRAEGLDRRYGLSALGQDDRLLAVGTLTGLGIWDLIKGRQVAFLAIGNPQLVTFEPSGALLTCSEAGLNRWPVDADPARADGLRVGPPHTLSDLNRPTDACGQSHDGRFLIMASGNGAWLFPVDDLRRARRLGPHTDVRRVAVSADGALAATGSWQRDGVKVWDAQTGRKVVDLLPNHHIDSLTFTQDGKWLVVQSNQESLQSLWFAVETWQPRKPMEAVRSTYFSPDGKLFACPGEGTTILVYDYASGRRLAVLEAQEQGRQSAVTFSRDGTLLVAADDDNPQVRTWDLRLIRSELAEIGLDWDSPPYPPPAEAVPPPVGTIRTDMGDLLVPRLYDQHLTQGRKDSEAGRWDDAVVEFSQAIQLRGQDPTAWWERARAGGRLGQWDKAKSDDARAVALYPVGMSAVWYDYAGVCVQTGDIPGCREVCRRLLNRPEPTNSEDCYWVARACILAPDAAADWRRPLHLAENAVADEATPWRIYVLAAASYRAGRYGETVCLCGRSMEAGPWQSVCLDYLLLAMAHHHLGDENAAQAWMVKATQEVEMAEKARREQGADAPITAFAAYCDWLDYQILHREAEALLADK